jgi:serine/threonine protein phosphatase PrpC
VILKHKFAGNFAQGKSHSVNNTPCQDVIKLWTSSNSKYTGIALADGAGFSDKSHIGAKYMVENILPFISNNFAEFYEDFNKASEKINRFVIDSLSKLSNSERIEFKNLASTLLFVCIDITNFKYLVAHIGDGIIFKESKNEVYVLSHPFKGEFANSTIFTTSKYSAYKMRVQSGEITSDTGFLICSDGAAEALYDRAQKKPNYKLSKQILSWLDNYSEEEVNKAIVSNLENGVFKEVTNDDCSLCILKLSTVETKPVSLFNQILNTFKRIIGFNT